MTHGEYIAIAITAGAGLVLISAIFSFMANRTIGWKLLFTEIVMTACVAAGCYYFLPDYDKSVLRKRYRTEVIDEMQKCQDRCNALCLGRKPKDD